jgi:hypothetical protein
MGGRGKLETLSESPVWDVLAGPVRVVFCLPELPLVRRA